MTREEAVSLARSVATREGWEWLEQVQARRSRRWLIVPARWEVLSNAGNRGRNVRVVIDDRTGIVLGQAFLPR